MKITEYGIFDFTTDELYESNFYSKHEALKGLEKVAQNGLYYVDAICKKHFGYPAGDCPKCQNK